MDIEHETGPRRERSPDRGSSAPAAADRSPAALLLHAQRSAGNRAVNRVVQAKLEVGAADDRYEREADSVAAVVARALRAPSTPASPPDDEAPIARRIQRRGGGSESPIGAEGGTLDDDTAAAVDRARGRGSSLPPAVASRMGDAFGTSFDSVRVHTDSTSDDLNRRMSATAFTTGSDIFFRQGAFRPGSAHGDELLAHELTHVVQQGGAAKRRIQREKTSQTTKDNSGYDTTTTKDHRGTKANVKADESTNTFDGSTEKSTSHKESTFAGAEAAVTKIKTASPTEVTDTVEYMARVGAFGESAREVALKRGKFSVGAKGSAKGGVGAETNLKAGLTVREDIIQGFCALFEAGAKVGASADLVGTLTAGAGPLAASITAQINAFAGASVKAGGTADIGLLHITLKGYATAFAGAEGSASGEVKVGVGEVDVTALVKVEGLAGAKAAAKGEFSIALTNLTLGGSVEAFAGVRAKAGGKVGANYKGKPLFSVEGKVEASAGIGGKAAGKLSFKNGKLIVSGDLAGCLGIGGGASLKAEIDFFAVAEALESLIVNAFLSKAEQINRNSPAVQRVPLLDQTLGVQKHKLGYETFLGDFRAYAAKKAKKGDSGIKREKVQAILDRKYGKMKDEYSFLETDNGVEQAARDAFGKDLTTIIIQAGQIRAFAATKKAGQAEREKAKFEKNLKR